MLGKKLIQILNTLERKEMTRFCSFVSSPYFNKHEKVQSLVRYLNQIFPEFNKENCSEEMLYPVVFPESPFEANKLAVIFTYTQRLLEDFLAVEWSQSNPALSQIGILEQFRQKKCYKEYEKQLKKAEKNTHEKPFGDSEDIFSRYQLVREKDIYYEQKEKRQKGDSLQMKDNLLDYFYLAEKFKDACEMQVRSKILRIDYNIRFIQVAIAEVEDNPEKYQAIPGIFMYYNIYKMLTQVDEVRYYHDSYDYLKEEESKFSRSELTELYNYLQNYCIAKINRGKRAFFKEIFLLYKSQLLNGLLLEKGILSEWHYKNIVSTGLHLGEEEWVKYFIDTYKPKLAPASAENAYRFNIAYYYHATGQYDKVLEVLSTVEYSDQRYNLGAKALLLRTYYELEELEPLVSLTDSFRQYMLRNKLMADQRRKAYYNSFKHTKRAALIRANGAFYTKEKLRKEIEQLERAIANTSNMLNKPWLVKKIGLLKEQYAIA